MPNALLLLVDGLAVAYRAYHAIPSLTSTSGEPTNALFGFIKMVRQLDEQWRPTHRAVIFDGGLPAARMKLLPTYKAQRDPMPEALVSQLDPIVTFLQLAGWSSIRPLDEEADDALATLAVASAQAGGKVLIASSDKDLLQLVDQRIQVIPPVKAAVPFGPLEVRGKMGVDPEQVVDLLALTGDTADNIPGVPGIGPKIAAQLLAEFRTLENLWNGLDRVGSERVRNLLQTHRAAVERNVELMRLRTDLPDLPAVDQLASRRPDVPGLVRFLEERDLHSVAKLYQEMELELF